MACVQNGLCVRVRAPAYASNHSINDNAKMVYRKLRSSSQDNMLRQVRAIVASQFLWKKIQLAPRIAETASPSNYFSETLTLHPRRDRGRTVLNVTKSIWPDVSNRLRCTQKYVTAPNADNFHISTHTHRQRHMWRAAALDVVSSWKSKVEAVAHRWSAKRARKKGNEWLNTNGMRWRRNRGEDFPCYHAYIAFVFYISTMKLPPNGKAHKVISLTSLTVLAFGARQCCALA